MNMCLLSYPSLSLIQEGDREALSMGLTIIV